MPDYFRSLFVRALLRLAHWGGRRGAAALLLGLLAAGAATAQTPPTPAASADEDVSEQVEAAYLALGRINAGARQLANTRNITEGLPDIAANLRTIDDNLSEGGDLLDARQLLTFQVLLRDMRGDLTTWRTTLADAKQQLVAMQRQLATTGQQVAALSPVAVTAPTAPTLPPTTPVAPADSARSALAFVDTLLVAPTAPDTVLAATLVSFGRKQQASSQQLATQRHALLRLQNEVSGNYIKLLELDDDVAGRLQQFGRRRLRPDARPLLRAALADTSRRTAVSQLLRRTYAGQQQLLGYYFGQHSAGWAWGLVVGGLFFGWVFRNFRRASEVAPEKPLDHRRLTHLRAVPVLGTLLVAFSLAPLFDLHAPAGYIDVLQLLLLLTLTGHLGLAWPRPLYRYWLGFAGLFLGLGLLYAVPLPGPGLRWLLLALSLGAGGLGLRWARRFRRSREKAGFVRPVLFLFIGLHGLATVGNWLGYLSAARLLSTAANSALVQIIALAVFIRLLTQALHLQMQTSRLSDGASARFDFQLIERRLSAGLSGLAGVLWFIVFLTSLNLYTTVYRLGARLLTTPHQLGSIQFSLLNLLLFGGIIAGTFQAQRLVGYFFGEADDSFSPEAKSQGSRLVVMRLLVFATGFLLAAAASGLPLDKIAIVFGALSVGIGLGLQTIVNNLVSGLILIFERPFQIGDYIEVKGQTGRVKDIGIRASKLVSQAGSEIIMPNGDLLAGHVINWTLSNNHIRVELSLQVPLTTDLAEARQLISAAVLDHPQTLPQVSPEVLLVGIAGPLYDVKVLFWIKNIRQEEVIKSEVLVEVHQRLSREGVGVA